MPGFPGRRLLLDATVLINLGRGRRLGLLCLVEPRPALIGRIARREVRFCRRADGSVEVIDMQQLIVDQLLAETQADSQEVERARELSDVPGIDAGEAEGAAIAEARSFILVTDDRTARRLFGEHAKTLRTASTSDLLRWLVEEGRLAEEEVDRALAACFPFGAPRALE